MNKPINFGKLKSIKRVHAIFCHVLEADMAAQTEKEKGSELEMECVLAVQKTKDDLLEKSKASRNRSVRELVSDGEDDKEKPDKPEKPGKKGKRT